MAALSSGVVTAFLQIIKVLAESRGPKFSLKIRRGKNKLEVTAVDVDEVLPVIRKLIGVEGRPRRSECLSGLLMDSAGCGDVEQ
jgi:hypothetical protein